VTKRGVKAKRLGGSSRGWANGYVVGDNVQRLLTSEGAEYSSVEEIGGIHIRSFDWF
jgi:hypothetical protein